MKRIFFGIFFYLALLSAPYTALAAHSHQKDDVNCRQSQSQSVEIKAEGADNINIEIDISQRQKQTCPPSKEGDGDGDHHVLPPAPPPPPSATNTPPVWTGITSASTTLGSLLQFSALATDSDSDELSFATELPMEAGWASSTGIFSWMPVATSSLGTSTAKFFASDGKATSTHEVVIEIFPAIATGTPATTTPNRPPFFVDFNPPMEATSSVEYSYDANAGDPDSDPLIFCLDISPAGMNISTSTGLISWIPTDGQASSTPHDITVCVTDGKSTTTANYQILVVASTTATTTPPVETPPTPSPPPSGGGGGSSTPPPTPSGGGGGGGPPLGLFGKVNVPPSSPAPPLTEIAQTFVPKPPPASGGTKPLSPPKSDSAPLKPIGGTIKPQSTASTSAPEINDRFFGLGALSLLGLLNIWNWLKAHCCIISWIFWLLTVIAFLIYIYYLKQNQTKNALPGAKGTGDNDELPPMIIEEEVPQHAEWEWEELKAQDENELL